jgi:probable HAF family extracellular repeat protein
MNYTKPSAHFSGILVVAIALVGAASARAQTYNVTDLGTINTDPQTSNLISHPTGINNAGQVTGYSYSGTSNHAARFTNGLVEDLGVIPGGQTSTGWGINGLGDVTGDSEYSVNGGSIRHAAVFKNGTVTDIGFLPGWGNYARGNGINNLGEVVGHSGPSLSTSNTRAFIWDAVNGMRDLSTLGGGYSKAFSINDSSVVTGHAQIGTGFGSDHAFIWDAVNGMRDLGTIAGSSSSGRFINANGHVVGWSSISTDNRRHAFLHDGTTMQDLGAIGDNDFLSDRSEAYGVNIHDIVVGTTYRPYQGGALYSIAFVYRDSQMLDLETLVDASGANYRLYTATGINDAGQIAVDAIRIGSPNQIRAVLLTPNQELVSAVSRKTHGAAGVYDVNLPLTSEPAVECRSGASGHTLVLTFMNDVTGGSASVTEGAATIAGNPSYSGKTMTVNLADVDDRQTISVMLSDVTDSFGQTLPPTNIRMSVLLGDSTGNNFVNASDVAQTKANSGSPLNGTNFRSDLTVNGAINSSDIAVAKAASGGGAPSRAE